MLQGYIDQCSTWGRWGPEDELGAVNLIDEAAVLRGTAAVRRGLSISLTMPYDASGPQDGQLRSNPQLLTTATGLDYLAGQQDFLPGGGDARGFGYSDDVSVIANQAGTQWDALSHIFWDGHMYNGRPASESTSDGAATNGIENLAGRMATRGLLVDAARLRGVDSLEPGDAIGPDDLDAWFDRVGLEPQSGDALLVRTGFLGARRGRWGDFAGGPAPGLSLHVAPWLHRHGIAAVVTDTWGVEVRPNEIGVFQPLHVVSLVHGGIPFGEMFDLDALADHCADSGVHEVLFVAPPLPLTGAAGSPVGAVALV